MQAWNAGCDINAIAGGINFGGTDYLVQNLYSIAYNIPMITPADKDDQIVRCEFLK